MHSSELAKVMTLVAEIFPLPLHTCWKDGTPFRGNHGFHFDRDKMLPGMDIWIDNNGLPFCQTILFEDEEITKELLLEIKAHLVSLHGPKANEELAQDDVR